MGWADRVYLDWMVLLLRGHEADDGESRIADATSPPLASSVNNKLLYEMELLGTLLTLVLAIRNYLRRLKNSRAG